MQPQLELTSANWCELLTDPAFYEAQAVILCKMGNHKQALEIYVFKMRDYVKAEE